MRYPFSRIVLCLALPVCLLGGCIAVGGSDNYQQPTLGRQLMDLKTARDTGAITPEEYERSKADLIAGKRLAQGH